MLQGLVDTHQAPHLEYHILPGPNWGMTVGALWDAWQWCKKNGITSDYWWTLDDDYICNSWPQRERTLDIDGYLMVGQWETCAFGDWRRDFYIKCWELGYKIPDGGLDVGVIETLKVLKARPEDRSWVDGGFYMMRYDGLQKLEDKVGCFMKCPNNPDGSRMEITVENGGYYEHGIRWGEVGFPTLIKGAGFTFCGFQEGSYLSHKWDRIDISLCVASCLSNYWDDDRFNGFYHDKPDQRGPYCLVKLPVRQNIRSLLLANKHLEPPNFPYRECCDSRWL
jgi:hypothetical protein